METVMRVAPGIHQFYVPTLNNPPGSINAYLVQTPEGCLLVDTRWKTREAFDAVAEVQ
jgi:hypothetical protein